MPVGYPREIDVQDSGAQLGGWIWGSPWFSLVLLGAAPPSSQEGSRRGRPLGSGWTGRGWMLQCPLTRHWQDLGYMILYITGRPDMQKQRVVSWLSQHNFPQGMIFFSDGLVHDPLRQKAIFLRNLVQEVSGQRGRGCGREGLQPPGLSSVLPPSTPWALIPLPHHLPSCTWMASWQSSSAWISVGPFTALPGGYCYPQ